MEAFFAKLVKGLESLVSFLKEIKPDISVLIQKVEMHAIAIKQLEHQFGQISATLNQIWPSTLSRNTIQNLKKNNQCIAITTWSGKAIIGLPILVVDEVRNDTINLNDATKFKTMKLVKNGEMSQLDVKKWVKNNKRRVKEVEAILKTITRPFLSFLQILKK